MRGRDRRAAAVAVAADALINWAAKALERANAIVIAPTAEDPARGKRHQLLIIIAAAMARVERC